MKKYVIWSMILMALNSCQQNKNTNNSTDVERNNSSLNYVGSRAPLTESPYLELPLGAIKPESWLMEQLHRMACLLYTSDAADDLLCVDLGGRRIIKKKKKKKITK